MSPWIKVIESRAKRQHYFSDGDDESVESVEKDEH